jgi:serine/threonine protein kinase/formylglycine-generating enzyme required for sulfatase activity
MTQPDPTPPELPPDFEEYRMLRPLGRGAMGQVVLAHDTALDRPVAIKLLSGIEPDARARERFFLEARALARVRHPNVVAIHRVGEARGRPYLVSEYVAGRSLDRVTRPLASATLLAVARGLAAGLAAAHRQGVLHRDIKPANAVLTPEGSVKLIDFGLAELRAAGPEITSPALPDAEARPAADVPGDADATISLAVTAPPAPPPREPREVAATGPRRRLAGTPLYMAPELWDGAPASPQSDLFALGTLLFELATGAAPLAGVPITELADAVRSRAAPPVSDRAPSLDARLASAIDRCLARAPGDRFASADALCDAIDEPGSPERATIDGCPYRGLLAFEAAHSAVFFGRSAEARALFDRLRSDALVVVTGDSGSGKSSLCRAGVLPLVVREGLGGGAAWSAVELVPGSHPIAALASALARRVGAAEQELAAAIRRDPFDLGRRLRERPGDEATIVLLDQLEEVMSLSDPDEAALAGAALAGVAIRAPNVRLLCTARSDFLTRLTTLPHFGKLVARSIFLVPAMDERDIAQAITGPAERAGVRFESEESVRELTQAALGAPAGLPLLQFALAELWERRDRARGVVPASALEEIGGVTGALARHADAVIEALSPEQRREARRALVALVTADGTRARRTLEDLAGAEGDASGAATRAALDAMVRGRLLVARASEDGRTAFEISHEALIARWETLRGWLRHDAEMAAQRQHIERAAADWHRLGQHRAALWGRVQLAEARSVDPASLGPRERLFLAASRRAVRRRRWALASAAAAALIVPAAIYAGVRAKARIDLDRAIDAHEHAAEQAEGGARRLAAEAASAREAAIATFHSGGRDVGEAAWAGAHARALQAEQAYAQATHEIEAAIALEDRPELRARLADLLLARTLAAEDDGRAADRDALRYHLSLVDRDGSRAAALAAGGSVIVRASAAAEVTLFPFVARDRNLALGPARALGPAPTSEIPLDQGSYLAELAAPGFETVRAPFLVRRGEHIALSIDMPPAGSLPEGFAYVPAGAFLFGSAEPDQRRADLFQAMPLHRAETGPFLIARHEVTFGDWIRYLETLPADERARAAPRARDERDDLELREIAPGRFRLTFDDGRVHYSAATGEPFVGRRGRKGVWERFPVVGISAADAARYAAWLGASLNLHDARICREDEWERAGRGADGRRYPMGERITAEMANISPVEGLDPDGFDPREVGSYPASRSVFGVDDLSGNAFEMTTSVIAKDFLVEKSGSWFQGTFHSRLERREAIEPTIRHPRIGVRICASWP